MVGRRIIFRTHALQRIFQRGINEGDIRRIVSTEETIEEYPDDMPYPSRLILGWIGARPVHVVASNNEQDNETIIITVYEPERNRWNSDFKRRLL